MNIHSQELDELEVLSEGELQRVAKCWDRQGEREVLARMTISPSTESSASLQQQFSLQRLLRDSGVVDAGDLITKAGKVVGLTMPIVEGRSLASAAMSLSSADLLRVIQDVCWATFSFHTLGFLHGDLTANNIWITTNSGGASAQLLDLEFVTPVGARSETMIRGTAGYVAPEISRGLPLVPAHDAYSFGKALEHSISHVKCDQVRGRLRSLSERCTATHVYERLNDFSELYFAVRGIAQECLKERIPHSRLSVPLRASGVQTRADSLRERIVTIAAGGVQWLGGGAGVGKSTVMRNLCWQMQSDGERTVRFTGVDNVNELLMGLESVFSRHSVPPVQAKPNVFVETTPDFKLTALDTKYLQKIAVAHGAAITVEIHQNPIELDIPRLTTSSIRTLSLRECIRATSHLLTPQTMIGPHAEAVFSATGGNPKMVCEAMSDYFRSGRRDRGEPMDFARFCPRSCASEVTPDTTSLLNPLRDQRLSLGDLLSEYRSIRRTGEQPPLRAFRTISEKYSELGSLRRRTRWARKGIVAASEIFDGPTDDSQLPELIGLLDYASSADAKLERLRALLLNGKQLSKSSQGLIRSEIGAALLHARRPSEARDVLYEALTLGHGQPESTKQEGVILNRLGTAKMLARDLKPAQRYFARALSCARRAGDKTTETRIEGNLGLHALSGADPASALAYFRRHRNRVLQTRQYSEYLTTLLNETTCFVDLGRGVAAERRARVAVSMAELLSDDMRLGYACSNLGWILTMRCQGTSAKDWLLRSLRIRERIGDLRGQAESNLNLARLFLLARAYGQTGAHVAKAQVQFESVRDEEGLWDCQRLLARMSLVLENYQDADMYLAAIPCEVSLQSEKDAADADVLRLEKSLWCGDDGNSRRYLEAIDRIPAVSRVHPLDSRRTMLRGFLALRQGDLNAALSLIGSAARSFRQSNREDLLLDALTVMSLLAGQMGNARMGLMYMRNLLDTTNRMKREVE